MKMSDFSVTLKHTWVITCDTCYPQVSSQNRTLCESIGIFDQYIESRDTFYFVSGFAYGLWEKMQCHILIFG